MKQKVNILLNRCESYVVHCQHTRLLCFLKLPLCFKGSRDEDKDVYGGSATNAWLATHLRAVAESARETTGASTVASRCCCGRKRRSRMFDASIASALQEPLPVARVKLVCGADLLQSFAVPDLWSEDDVCPSYWLHNILAKHEYVKFLSDFLSRPGVNAQPALCA